MTLLKGTSINEILRKREHEIIEECKKDIARNLIREGYSIDQIAELTKLDINSIKQLTLEK